MRRIAFLYPLMASIFGCAHDLSNGAQGGSNPATEGTGENDGQEATDGASASEAAEAESDGTDPGKRTFNPAALFRTGEASSETTDPKPSPCGWLLSFDAVVVGDISAIAAVRTPAVALFGRADNPLVYGAPEECLGDVRPALDITLSNGFWLTGSAPSKITVRLPQGVHSGWSPSVDLGSEGEPFWFEDKVLLVGDSPGIGMSSISYGGGSLSAFMDIPPFTFDVSGGVQHPGSDVSGLRSPEELSGMAFEELEEEASGCTDPGDIATGNEWRYAYETAASNSPLNQHAAECFWDEPPTLVQHGRPARAGRCQSGWNHWAHRALVHPQHSRILMNACVANT